MRLKNGPKFWSMLRTYSKLRKGEERLFWILHPYSLFSGRADVVVFSKLFSTYSDENNYF